MPEAQNGSQPKFTGAELRQFENGSGRPEVAIVLHFASGKALFSIVGYDVYKQHLAEQGDSPDATLNLFVRVAGASQGTPSQPVFYNLSDVLPADGDKSAAITLDNLRNDFVQLASTTVGA